MVGTVAVTVAFYGLTRYVGIDVEVGVVDEQRGKGKGAHSGGQSRKENEWQDAGQEVVDDDDEEYDDALLFLPTGLSRPGPKTFYRGSDPEWQEFKQVATDLPRVEKIRGTHSCLCLRGMC